MKAPPQNVQDADQLINKIDAIAVAIERVDRELVKFKRKKKEEEKKVRHVNSFRGESWESPPLRTCTYRCMDRCTYRCAHFHFYNQRDLRV